MAAIFKEAYKGRGIYWHGGSDYGDETQVFAKSIAECRKKIDDIPPPFVSEAQLYFASLGPSEKRRIRQEYAGDLWEKFPSVAEYALSIRKQA